MLQYRVVETIGQRIKYLRKKRGWSQEQLLIQVRRQLGDFRAFHRVTLSRIENDHQQPSEKLLPVLAQVLGTTTDYLLGLTDDPRPRQDEAGAAVPPDLEPLIERLSRLEPEERRKVVDGFIHILDVMQDLAEADEDEWPPEIQEFVQLFDQLPEEQRARFRRLLEEEVAREQGHSAVA